jgi:hypothetical protein
MYMELEYPNYQCNKCNYQTSRLSHWKRHINTNKHLQRMVNGQYSCTCCNRIYKHYPSLVRHQRECELRTYGKQTITTTSSNVVVTDDSKTSSDISQLTGLVHTLLQENKELQKKLIEITNEPKIINNNTFNMMNFLNSECKDALNFKDFITNLQISFKQLRDTAEYGYLHGIESAFITEIKKLKQTERPIHCTDLKRFTFYMKDDDEWNKQTGTEEIDKALGTIINKQFNCLQQWKIDNPDWNENQQKYDIYVDIMSEITKGDSEIDGLKFKRRAHKLIGEVCKFHAN